MDNLYTLEDFAKAAVAVLPHMAAEYLEAGVGDEITLRQNALAFDRLRLRPRVLTDVSRLDTRSQLLGQEMEFPIFLAPTGYHRLMHPEGELATVRGAGEAAALLVASSFSTTSIEDMAAVATGPLWFQLYVSPDRGFTRELVERAQAAGCSALVLTVDLPVLGVRTRELRSNFGLPPGVERANLRTLGNAVAAAAHRPRGRTLYSAVRDPALSWADLEWLRGLLRVPLILKGILSGEDAAQGVAAGADAIYVSNHGGRSLDTLPAAMEALPEVVEAVGGRVPVLMDGGVRRGTDVVKALALGASAVGIGRPYVHGLAVGGAAGVTRVVEILRTELEMAMALTGRRTLGEIGRQVLW